MKIKDWQMWKDLKEPFREELTLAKESKTTGILWVNIISAIVQPLMFGLLIMMICLQLGFGLFGVDYNNVVNLFTDSYDYGYLESIVTQTLGTLLVFGLLLLVVTIFVCIFIPTANLNAFRTIIVEKRKVSLGEYFGGLFKGSGRYLGYNILHVTLPLFGIGIVVGILSYIPILNFTFDNLWIGISMAFYYRCCLKLFRVNDKEIMNKEWRRWMFFSVLAVALGATINETFAVVLVSLLAEFDASYMAYKYEPGVYKNFNLNVHEMYMKSQEEKKQDTKPENKSENKPDANGMMNRDLEFGKYEIKETIVDGEVKEVEIEKKEEPKAEEVKEEEKKEEPKAEEEEEKKEE